MKFTHKAVVYWTGYGGGSSSSVKWARSAEEAAAKLPALEAAVLANKCNTVIATAIETMKSERKPPCRN